MRIKAKTLANFLLLVSFVICVLLIIKVANTQNKNLKLVSPLPEISTADNAGSQTLDINADKKLQDIIDKELSGHEGTYGIVVKNLKTGQTYSLNENRVFEPGSLYKIWIMGTVVEQIEKVKIKEDDILKQEASVLNNKFHIATESAEIKEGVVSMTVAEALEKMITISSNYAALLLSEKVRLSNVTSFLKTNGFKYSTIGEPPKTTPADIALFFEKLYRGELGTQEGSQIMLNILKKQVLKNKIPKYLPKGTVIAHKTGEIDEYNHDAGIVYTDKGDYLIVIMTQNMARPEAEKQIAKISKAVYDTFNLNIK